MYIYIYIYIYKMTNLTIAAPIHIFIIWDLRYRVSFKRGARFRHVLLLAARARGPALVPSLYFDVMSLESTH